MSIARGVYNHNRGSPVQQFTLISASASKFLDIFYIHCPVPYVEERKEKKERKKKACLLALRPEAHRLQGGERHAGETKESSSTAHEESKC